MPADSVMVTDSAHVIRLRTIELLHPAAETVRYERLATESARLPRFSKWRRAKRVKGTFALAELGRETGARC